VLSLYRRHRSKRPHADDRISRKCRCAIWATGTIEGKPFRQSLKTRNFERAETLKRKLEDGVTPREKGITIKDATDAFIKDCQARNPESQHVREIHAPLPAHPFFRRPSAAR
jgi:hypothetical protein